MSAAGPQINGGGDVTAFASGLVSLLQPVVIECDQRLQGVFDSQRLLAAQIDGLASQLDKFNAVSRTPALSPHIDKLLRAKARMVVINTTLANIQHRLVRIQREHAPAPRPSGNVAEGVAPPCPASPSSSTPSSSLSSPSSSQPAPALAPSSSSSSTSTPTAPAAAAAQPAGGGGGVMSSWLNKAKAALVEAPASLSSLAGPSTTTAQPAAAATTTTAPSPSAGLEQQPPSAAEPSAAQEAEPAEASAEPTNEPAQEEMEEQQPQPEEVSADKTAAAAEADDVVAPAEEATTATGDAQPTPAAE